MRKLVIALSILASSSLMSQDTEVASRYTVGAYFSPEAVNLYMPNSSQNESHGSIDHWRNSRAIPKFGYSTGLSIAYDLNDKFSLETGLQISEKGYHTKKEDLGFGGGISYPYFIGLSPTELSLEYRFQYIGIPVNLNYTAGSGKWKFISSIGITAEYLVEASRTTLLYHYKEESFKTKEENDKDYRDFSLSPSISVGVDYQINPRISLRAMPTLRVGVIPVLETENPNYLYNAGLQIGWYITL